MIKYHKILEEKTVRMQKFQGVEEGWGFFFFSDPKCLWYNPDD